MEKSTGDTNKVENSEQLECSEKVKDNRKRWTYDAEPVLILHMALSFMVYNLVKRLLVEKSCLVNLRHSEAVCDAIVANGQTVRLLVGTTFTEVVQEIKGYNDNKSSGAYFSIRQNADAEMFVEEEKKIQKFVGNVMVWTSILENIFPMALVLLIGAWSDKYGRKPPMLFLLAGSVLQNIGLMFCVYFKYTTGAWTVAIVSFIFIGLSGGNSTFVMAIFSYVADKTSTEKISVRNGISNTCLFLGLVLGLASTGITSSLNINLTLIFIIAAAMEGLGFVYVWYVIENTRDEEAVKGKSTADMFRDLFDIKHVKDTISSVFKERPGNTRMMLWVLLFSYMCILAPMFGELNATYLFGRYKFNWNSSDIAYFLTYNMIIHFLGNIVSTGILAKALKISDPAVGITCCLSGVIGRIVFANANSVLMMYIGGAVTILSDASIVVPRSLISKVIPANEMGKVSSFMACLENVVPLFITPMITLLYTNTFETFPGAFFLLTAFFMILPVFAFTWILSFGKENIKAE